MTGRVNFRKKKNKIIESILYLAHKGIELDQYKLVKLLYLADREHLNRFGRPITFDHYVAMKHGPVASTTYDIAKGTNVYGVDKTHLPFDIVTIENLHYIENPKREIERELFSKSDLMVLDEIVEKFGGWSFKQLFEYTHEHFAYRRAWENRHNNAEPMRYEDFLEERAEKEEIIEELEAIAHAI